MPSLSVLAFRQAVMKGYALGAFAANSALNYIIIITVAIFCLFLPTTIPFSRWTSGLLQQHRMSRIISLDTFLGRLKRSGIQVI